MVAQDSTSFQLSWRDIKHVAIYSLITFLSLTIGDITSHELVSHLHELSPYLEVFETGISGVLAVIGFVLKKWLQDNSV